MSNDTKFWTRKLQFTAGPEAVTFTFCNDCKEKGHLPMCFFATDKDPWVLDDYADYDPVDRPTCEMCREP